MTSPSRGGAPRRSAIDRALAGWQPARVLMAANRLGFFTALGDEALSAEEIATRCGSHPRSTGMLLNACVALGLLEKEGAIYRNTAEGRRSLVRGRPGYLGDAIAHQEDLWGPWSKLHEAVRLNRSVGGGPSLMEDPERHRNFILAMHNRAMRVAPVLAEALELGGRRQLFDVGGGPGTFSIFLVKRYPGLRAIVFDLPRTLEIAKEIIAEFGVPDRVATRAGDYFRDGFGEGNDAVLLSAILHSMGPERALDLLRKAHASLVPGGLVVIHEGLVSDDGTSPVRTVLFSLNMLVNTGEGQSYSAAELTALLESAGFADPRVVALPQEVGTSLVIGVRR